MRGADSGVSWARSRHAVSDLLPVHRTWARVLGGHPDADSAGEVRRSPERSVRVSVRSAITVRQKGRGKRERCCVLIHQVIVLLSGGVDSTAAILWARTQY